ncbi:Chromodomain Y-like protein 2 [Balamuthia mandrillaris]
MLDPSRTLSSPFFSTLEIHSRCPSSILLNTLLVSSSTLSFVRLDSTNIFIIHHCTDNGVYILQDITGDILPDKVPPSALKPVDPDTPFEDEHFKVEKVLDHDGPPSNRYYLVK